MSIRGLVQGVMPGGDRETRERLRRRARGQDSLARAAFIRQQAASQRASGRTAARAADAGLNPAQAQRIAARQQAGMDAASGQQYAQQSMAERQRAEDQLATLREQRAAFQRQMLGSLVGAAGSVASTLGIGGGGPVADASFAGRTAQGVASLQEPGNLGALAGGMAGGPLGAMAGQALGGAMAPGGMGQTLSMVDGALGTQAGAAPSTAQVLGPVEASNPFVSPPTEEEQRRAFLRMMARMGL